MNKREDHLAETPFSFLFQWHLMKGQGYLCFWTTHSLSTWCQPSPFLNNAKLSNESQGPWRPNIVSSIGCMDWLCTNDTPFRNRETWGLELGTWIWSCYANSWCFPVLQTKDWQIVQGQDESAVLKAHFVFLPHELAKQHWPNSGILK